MSNASNAVAALEDTLTRIKTAAAKTSSDMHDQGGGTSGKATSLTSSTPAADDGDTSQPTGDLQREQIADVKDQQDLSHEKETGAADSPAFNNAADSTGSVDETTADADSVKNDSDDDQHASPSSHPARTDNSKIASLQKTANELMEGNYDEEEESSEEEGEGGSAEGGEPTDDGAPSEGVEGDAEGNAEASSAEAALAALAEGGEGLPPEGMPMEGGMPPEGMPMEGGMPPEGMPPEGMPMEGGMPPEGMPMEGGMPPEGGDPLAGLPPEILAQIEALLGGVNPKVAAAIPDLPEDEASFTKVASEGGVDDYMEKVAQAYPDDVQQGYNFAENLFANLTGQVKTANEDEVGAIRKLAMGDAGNVADIMAGMSEGGAAEGMAGIESPLAGMAPMGGEEVGINPGISPGGDAGINAEAILAALQQSGIADDQITKVAAAAGLPEAEVKAVLAKAGTV